MMDFKKCPRFFKYKSLQIFHPVVDQTRLLFGGIIHKAIKKYYQAIPDIPRKNTYVNQIKSTADSALKQAWVDWGSQLARFLSTANKMIENFVKFEIWRYKNKGTPFRPTVFEKDLASSRFHALPDVYDRGLLIDWKTGKSQQLKLEYKMELWIQAEVLDANGWKTDDLRMGLLRYNKFVGCPEPNFSWLYQERDKVNEAIESNSFPPNYSHLCWWCEYKLRCDYEGSDDPTGKPCHIKQRLSISSWNKPIRPQKILFVNPYT
jgi:hypothetical protein